MFFAFKGNEHCNLFMWIDPPWCPRASSVIKGLQRNRNILQNQLRSLRDSKARMQVELDVMRAKEMILDEEVNESRAKENKGWIVGIVYWMYLLAAKFAMQKMIEGNDELEASYEYLQNEVHTLRLKMRKLCLILIMLWFLTLKSHLSLDKCLSRLLLFSFITHHLLVISHSQSLIESQPQCHSP